MSQAGRALPSPLPPRSLGAWLPEERIQFHIRTPGCDPIAPLKNPRWRLLEAPAGSTLAASLLPLIPRLAQAPAFQMTPLNSVPKCPSQAFEKHGFRGV